MRERNYPTLEGLEKRAARLTRVIGQREVVYSEIGTKTVRPITLEDAIKVGRSKSRVKASIDNLDTVLQNIKSEIENYQDPEGLMTSASTYLEERDRKSAQLRELRALARQGHLEQDVIRTFEDEFRSFSGRPLADPTLKRGIGLLEEQKAAEEETKPKAQMRIDRKRNRIEITYSDQNKRVVENLPPVDFAVLIYLASHSKENRTRKQVEQAARRAGSIFYASFGWLIKHLRDAIEQDPKSPKILNTLSYGASYKLDADVRFSRVGKRSERVRDRETRRELDPVPQSRINALEEFVTQETSLNKIIDLLGPDKNGRRLTWPQAKFAMKRAASLLYRRSVDKTATEEEVTGWLKIKEILGHPGHNADLQVKELLSSNIESWFQEKRPS